MPITRFTQQGFVLDQLNTLAGLFQISTGAPAVTAVEQPVGLAYDKRGVVAIGNHARQATAAARATLSARVNLLTKTEQFDNSDWVTSNTTLVPNAATAPDGTMTAEKLVNTATGSGNISKYMYLPAGVNSFSVHAEQAGAVDFGLASAGGIGAIFNLATGVIVSSLSGTTATIESLPSGRYRCEISFVVAVAGNSTLYISRDTGPFGAGEGVFIWGAQHTLGSKSRYQRVNTDTDYDTAGFSHYLKFNGVDTGLAAPTGGSGGGSS